jgi:uncharacterized protein (TIGR02996 family)
MPQQPLTLTLSHPQHPVRRIQTMWPSRATLWPDGRWERWGSAALKGPEYLELIWEKRAHYLARGGAQVFVGSETRGGGQLRAGETLRWHEFTIAIDAVASLSDEERALADAARLNDDALSVYADWLEGKGEALRAEWIRLWMADPSTERTAALEARLDSMAPGDRALVSRCRMMQCNHFGTCASAWHALPVGALAWVRRCGVCEQNVTWCEDHVAWRSLKTGAPVAVDSAARRVADKPRDWTFASMRDPWARKPTP